ncbi:hypothetical protein J3Q64DRAFT_1725334 [Phycomyces blakesleeanus]|uniref:DUF1754-domain-containing protein n=2 Tax=Phycomyces blakesleeanus TaxID=4837 RepID=A0A167R2I8_PHYB8|nr:hypothetical protein PHYBLDRAFT_61751 [Phycomyces blakesleeanus NRRL 1555(-)]OAD80698.1 hypothetical protein PHYBLDRAFT_61751 [Phycomyces blakesleeanus NRRL 1555(-)]|eukprot:XP_018298738.1 hypothetical protein PHYBLDRAFT_61751 [Phycomyces blakesleeanus NRRL 1555(-)]
MSAYDQVSKGSLKFKGSDSPIKKKKKKAKSEREKFARAIQDEADGQKQEDSAAHRVTVVEKTEAERKFEETKLKRQMERVAKAATRSHKENVYEFNKKLEHLSEHYDIPKVGPG